MKNVARWSLPLGALLAGGLVYAYSRRSNARFVLSGTRSTPDAASFDEALLPYSDDDAYLEALDEDLEFVDLDALDPDDPFDAVAPENLGAEWMARPTQTLGVPTSETSGEADDWEPTGRPTGVPSSRV